MDGAITFSCDPADDDTCPSSIEAIRAIPGIAEAGRFAITQTPILDRDGHLVQIRGDDPCASGAGGVQVLTPLDGAFGTTLNRVRILDGRAADPTRADEVVMAPLAAEEFGVEVGDVLYPRLRVDCEVGREQWGAPTPVTVVGIGMSAAEIPPKSGFYIQGIHTTPAFAELPEYADRLAGLGPGGLDDEGVYLGVELEDDLTLEDLSSMPGVPPFDVALDLDTTFTQPIDDGLRADANALWLVAALAGLASLILVLPALDRHAASMVAVDTTLASMGWTRRDRVARGLAHGLAVAAFALVTLATVVVIASTRTPIGDARSIDPDPGAEVDALPFALGLGGAILLSTVGLGLLVLHRAHDRPARRRTPISRWIARRGAPVTAVLGVRIGLEPGRRQAPMRTSLVAVAIGGAAIVGALIYTSSAQNLRQNPGLAGLTWDDFLYAGDLENGIAVAERAADWPEVEAAGHLGYFTPQMLLGEDRALARALAFGTGPAFIEPAVIEGRAPAAADEILLAPHLAGDLGLGIGDLISGTFLFDEGPEPVERPARDFEVVGIGPVPLGDGNYDVGTAITFEGYLSFLPDEMAAEAAAGRTDFVMIRRAAGVDDRAIAARAETEGLEFEPDFNSANALEGLVSIDITSTESAPDLLALLMTLMAGGILAYALASAVSRDRHDLSVARALGLRPRQVRRTAAWAAVAFTSAALLIALPLGIVAGRLTWRAYAESLGVVPTPFVPWNELAGLAAATLLLAVLLDLAAAWRQNRLSTAEVLRSE